MNDNGLGSRGHTTVITEARPSYDDEFRSRRRRYVIMMAMRLPCLVAAALLYHTPWLAILIILISIPLPWCAVLIANDGPARKPSKRRRRVFTNQRALPAPRREIVEATETQADASDGEADQAADGATPGDGGTGTDGRTAPAAAGPNAADDRPASAPAPTRRSADG